MKVIRATSDHLSQLSKLFDLYRVFYQQPSNLDAAKAFLKDRFRSNDSVIFIAIASDGTGLGFTQLYPSFSSVSLMPIYILNDLFVSSEARKKGVGEALLEKAKHFTISRYGKGLTLETAIDNPAQKLYVRLGFKKDSEVNHYTWEV
jgi:ribosomal protein S18 acetylase RimI-like enzyme